MIIFNTDISETKLLMAYNNQVIIFYSDSALVPLNCQITGLGINATLYPKPDGLFRFNFKEYIMAAINTKNFADDLQPELIPLDSDSFTYDVSNGVYLSGNVLIRINFLDASFESTTKTLQFLAGVEQIESYRKNEIIIADADYVVLSKLKSNTSNTTYLKYFAGYPFEFSFFTTKPLDSFSISNTTTSTDYQFTGKGKITSLFLSDGSTDVSIEDFISLAQGTNILRIKNDEGFQTPIIELEKQESSCGIYLKFLNNYGRWNYWLFSKHHNRNRRTQYFDEIDNDFNNLESTISPTIQIGKASQDSIKCIAERIYEHEKELLESIIDSPKILMFTGERFSRTSPNDWIEVKLRTSDFMITEPKTKQFNFLIDIQLPNRNTQTL